MRRWLTLASCALLAGSGCYVSHGRDAGGEPLPSDTLEIDLSDEEYLALCEWFARQQRGGWPEERFYTCLDGGAVGRVLSPEDCVGRRHSPASIPGCRFRVEDWYSCADYYAEHGFCASAPSLCQRPDECMDGTGRWRYLHP